MTAIRLALAAAFSLGAATAQAAVLDVLWLGGSEAYNARITDFAGTAPVRHPETGAPLALALDLWMPGEAVDLETYDLLVVGASCNTPRTGSTSGSCGGSGFYGSGVTLRNVLTNGPALGAALGDRMMLSGLASDWHLAFDPDPQLRDDAALFLANAVGWAGSGDGLGFISMTDRSGNRNGWWRNVNSILPEHVVRAAFDHDADMVAIAPGQAGFPAHWGLSEDFVRDWHGRAHLCFDTVTDFTAVNLAASGPGRGCAVTVVRPPRLPDAASVPLPASSWILLAGLAVLAGLRRRTG